MQLQLQTRRPEFCVVLINGPDADSYDLRCVEDLLEPWISIRRIPHRLTTREASCQALMELLNTNAELFFKIDSDDIYQREYLAEYLRSIGPGTGRDPPAGWCANLIDQYWWNAGADGSASIRRVGFRQGLGLSKREQDRGVRIGAPPTFAFDRRVAELLTAQSHRPPYDQIDSDDQCWRTILIDHDIVIRQIETSKPVFGYLRHADNTSNLRSSNSNPD
jgi:hypothetical protein